jgi:hypothetical protein
VPGVPSDTSKPQRFYGLYGLYGSLQPVDSSLQPVDLGVADMELEPSSLEDLTMFAPLDYAPDEIAESLYGLYGFYGSLQPVADGAAYTIADLGEVSTYLTPPLIEAHPASLYGWYGFYGHANPFEVTQLVHGESFDVSAPPPPPPQPSPEALYGMYGQVLYGLIDLGEASAALPPPPPDALPSRGASLYGWYGFYGHEIPAFEAMPLFSEEPLDWAYPPPAPPPSPHTMYGLYGHLYGLVDLVPLDEDLTDDAEFTFQQGFAALELELELARPAETLYGLYGFYGYLEAPPFEFVDMPFADLLEPDESMMDSNGFGEMVYSEYHDTTFYALYGT